MGWGREVEWNGEGDVIIMLGRDSGEGRRERCGERVKSISVTSNKHLMSEWEAFNTRISLLS